MESGTGLTIQHSCKLLLARAQPRVGKTFTFFAICEELRRGVRHGLDQQLNDTLVVGVRRRRDRKEAGLALADAHLRVMAGNRCMPIRL